MLMKYLRVFILLLFPLVIFSCETESTSYNPDLEGTYLCEAHIKRPAGYWTSTEDDIWCPVGMTGFDEASMEVMNETIVLAFDSENTFVINEIESINAIQLFDDMSISLGEAAEEIGAPIELYGTFHSEDSLTFHMKLIKRSSEHYGTTSSFGEVTDDYYCIKQ